MKTVGFAVLLIGASSICPPEDFETIKDLDLDVYASKRWYIQQQMVTPYLPKTQNWCVFAQYSRRQKKSFWGYDIDVHNHAEEQDGTVHDSEASKVGIMAKIIDEKRGKLEVAPGWLPTQFSGDYWVIAYDEAEGYTLVSGGAPKNEGANGKCKTGSGVNGSGLWIFTRAQQPDKKLIEKVRGIAFNKGFDLTVLNDIDQSNCKTKTLETAPQVDTLVV